MIHAICWRINRELANNAWTLALGVVLGLCITATAFYLRPVVTMQGEITARTPNSVTVHVWGAKHRNCRFIDIAGYSAKAGLMFDAKAVRQDMPEDGATKPVGVFDIGYWLVEPITGADKALMYVTHSCGPGDIRVTKIAEVVL